MKILYVITGADIGGAQKHLLYLSEWFSKEGHSIHVVLGEDGPFKSELESRNIDVTIIPVPRTIVVWKDFKALLQLFRFIKREKYEIVHSHSSKAGIIARFAAFLNRVPKNIFTAHGFVFTDPTLSKKKKAFYLMLEKVFGWMSTHIITVSHFDYQQGKAHGIPEQKMHVIHNGIPENSIMIMNNWEKKQLRLRAMEKRIVGFVGRFASEKNIDMLIRVASLFREANNMNVEFWMIGDGPLFDHYREKIKGLGLDSMIVLKGSQNDVLSWMDQMHVMAITSHKEGLPFVLLEACGRGLPVVSTDVGGIKEVIDPKGNQNLLVKVNDDVEMYQRLFALLSNDSVREEQGKYFLELAHLHSTEQMCLKTNGLYVS